MNQYYTLSLNSDNKRVIQLSLVAYELIQTEYLPSQLSISDIFDLMQVLEDNFNEHVCNSNIGLDAQLDLNKLEMLAQCFDRLAVSARQLHQDNLNLRRVLKKQGLLLEQEM